VRPTVFLLYAALQKQFAELHCYSALTISGSKAQLNSFFLVSNPPHPIDLVYSRSPSRTVPGQARGKWAAKWRQAHQIASITETTGVKAFLSTHCSVTGWLFAKQKSIFRQFIYSSSCCLYHSQTQIHTSHSLTQKQVSISTFHQLSGLLTKTV